MELIIIVIRINVPCILISTLIYIKCTIVPDNTSLLNQNATIRTNDSFSMLQTDEMIMMSVYWMEVAITAMPADKSQVTFLFDRTGENHICLLPHCSSYKNFCIT